jgi:hypothetical protein
VKDGEERDLVREGAGGRAELKKKLGGSKSVDLLRLFWEIILVNGARGGWDAWTLLVASMSARIKRKLEQNRTYARRWIRDKRKTVTVDKNRVTSSFPTYSLAGFSRVISYLQTKRGLNVGRNCVVQQNTGMYNTTMPKKYRIWKTGTESEFALRCRAACGK